MRCAIALVLLGGCQLVFGVEPTVTEPIGDAGADGASDDAGDGRVCTSSTPYTMQVIEDTFIVPDNTSCNPSIRFGTFENLNVGQNDLSRVLLRFQLPKEVVSQLQQGLPLDDARLSLAVSDLGISSELELAVYPLTNEWNEGFPMTVYSGASWCNAIGVDAGTQTPWNANGADGFGDRGQIPLGGRTILAIETMPNNVVDVKLPAARISSVGNWVSTDKGYLSLILVRTSATGTLFLQAREANQIPARLEMRVCD
ncbi:MAG TPA: hypothetical protein VM513_13470 [Kofleriaceae bacterium]|jgi:hypothetical protein|nr:hypothetical protein [Kofleriaceae bacterium]